MRTTSSRDRQSISEPRQDEDFGCSEPDLRSKNASKSVFYRPSSPTMRTISPHEAQSLSKLLIDEDEDLSLFEPDKCRTNALKTTASTTYQRYDQPSSRQTSPTIRATSPPNKQVMPDLRTEEDVGSDKSGKKSNSTNNKRPQSPRMIRSRSPDSRSFFNDNSTPQTFASRKSDALLQLYDSDNEDSAVREGLQTINKERTTRWANEAGEAEASSSRQQTKIVARHVAEGGKPSAPQQRRRKPLISSQSQDDMATEAVKLRRQSFLPAPVSSTQVGRPDGREEDPGPDSYTAPTGRPAPGFRRPSTRARQ